MSEAASAEASTPAAAGDAAAPAPPAVDPNQPPGPYPVQQAAEGGQQPPPPAGYPGYPPQYYQHYGYPPHPAGFQPSAEGAAEAGAGAAGGAGAHGNAPHGGAYPGYPPAYAFHGQHYPGQYPYGAAAGVPPGQPPAQPPAASAPPPAAGAGAVPQQPDDSKADETTAAAAAAGQDGDSAASAKDKAANGSKPTVMAGTDKYGKPRIETVGYAPPSAIAALKQGSPQNKEEPLSTAAVEPMKQDFYFFAVDNKEEYLAQAKAAVREAISTAPPTTETIEEDDPYLTMTNLNERLMASWLEQPRSVRTQYLSKEEGDRRRFQLDDEVASRHCATLTARSRSPRIAKRFEFEPAKPDQPFPTLSELNREKDGANKRAAAATAENDGEANAKRSRASASNESV